MTSLGRILLLALAALACGALPATAQPQECTDDQLRALPLENPQPVESPVKTQEMRFAQKNKLPLELRRHDIQKISISWQSEDRGVLAPVSDPSLERSSDASGFIEVVPPALGKLRLELMVVFEDCFFEDTAVSVSVPVPAETPDAFVLAWTNWRYVRKIGVAHLDFGNFSGLVVTPLAFYKGFDDPAPILGNDVEFTVIAPKGHLPSMAFDPSFRSVKPLRTGQSLIKGTFRGKSDYICVDVTRDAATAPRDSNCRDLLPPGKTVPADPVDVPVRPQH